MKSLSNRFQWIVLCFSMALCLISHEGWADPAIVINLDPDNSSGKKPDYAASFFEGQGPVNIADADAAVEDREGSGLTEMSIRLNTPLPGDILTAVTGGTSISTRFSGGVLTLSGRELAAHYQQVLRTVQFNNISQNPGDGQRVIEVTGRSDTSESETVVCHLAVFRINSPPRLHVPGPQVTPRNEALRFRQEDENEIRVSDPDESGGDITLTLSVDPGILTTGEGSGAAVESNQSPRVIIIGSVNQLNAELEGLRYDPPQDWHGVLELVVDAEKTAIGLTSRETVQITVAVTVNPNKPPVSDAGDDQTTHSFTRVFLNGTGSYDPDGEIVLYEWRQAAGPGVSLKDADTPSPSFIAPETHEDQTLVFELKVTDITDIKDTDQVSVLVKPASPDGTFKEGSTVTLNAPPGWNFYEWTQTHGPSVVLSDPASSSPTFIAPMTGPEGTTLVFDLSVKNTDGGSASSQSIIKVSDNGITGFPDGVLTFRPTASTAMGIQVEGGDLVVLKGVPPSEIPDMVNRPKNLIYGLIEMEIKLPVGGAAAVVLFLEKPAASSFRWFKYSGKWIDLGDHAVFSADRTRVSLHFNDGGTGDNDGQANGIIKDPSGLGEPGDDTTEGGAGDSGGGCFIRSIIGAKPGTALPGPRDN